MLIYNNLFWNILPISSVPTVLHPSRMVYLYQNFNFFNVFMYVFLDALASIKPHIVVQNRRIQGTLPENPGCIAGESVTDNFSDYRITT